jgi:hypothetical protein
MSDHMYYIPVPGQPGLAKVGRTKDVLQRERALSCGSVIPWRATAVFVGAGKLESIAHRLAENFREANEVFRIDLSSMKLIISRARKEYLRDQRLVALRSQDDQPPSKRRRTEDLQLEDSRMALEERQLALDEKKAALEHRKAMNSMELREREANLRERDARLTMELREREAKLKSP